MDNDVKIRIYNDKTDQEEVIQLWKTIFPLDSPHNDPLTSINRKIIHKDDLFFIAELDGRIVGTIMAGYDGHRGWIYSLAVDSAFRRKDIGTLLLKYAENELLKRNCPKINLQILASNEGVKKFYEKNGYKIEERISMGKRLY
jgi:ribosomal protein S18 acetylase RimI-like enzyme